MRNDEKGRTGAGPLPRMMIVNDEQEGARADPELEDDEQLYLRRAAACSSLHGAGSCGMPAQSPDVGAAWS